MQLRARFDHAARRFHPRAMARDARQMAPLRPPAVAVHDDGHVIGQAFRVELCEKFRFLAVGGL